MTKLLAKFRTLINWQDYRTWTIGWGSWTFDNDDNGYPYNEGIWKCRTVGNGKIQKNMLETGKRYSIKFEMTNWIGGSLKVRLGGNESGWIYAA